METITITPKNKVQKMQILAILKKLNISFENVKKQKTEINKKEETKAFLYNSQKNAAKLFAKYL